MYIYIHIYIYIYIEFSYMADAIADVFAKIPKSRLYSYFISYVW